MLKLKRYETISTFCEFKPMGPNDKEINFEATRKGSSETPVMNKFA